MSGAQGKRSRVDLSRLEMNSLLKYARMYRLPEAGKTKEDLVFQVSKHFNAQQVGGRASGPSRCLLVSQRVLALLRVSFYA